MSSAVVDLEAGILNGERNGGKSQFIMAQPELSPEISDLIVSFDAETLVRQPVQKREVLDRFLAVGNRRVARIVGRVPDRVGALDPVAVDALLVREHTELQRHSEE